MKFVKLSEFLTDEQIQAAWDIYETVEKYVGCPPIPSQSFVTRVGKEIIEPNISVIELKLGQQYDSRYLAHAIQFVFDSANKRKGGWRLTTD